jgi:adenylylsulfate kinase-like enzyme
MRSRSHSLNGDSPHTLARDELRATLSADLSFSLVDRAEQVRRAAHLARILGESGVIPLVALVSPIRADREGAVRTRTRWGSGRAGRCRPGPRGAERAGVDPRRRRRLP